MLFVVFGFLSPNSPLGVGASWARKAGCSGRQLQYLQSERVSFDIPVFYATLSSSLNHRLLALFLSVTCLHLPPSSYLPYP